LQQRIDKTQTIATELTDISDLLRLARNEQDAALEKETLNALSALYDKAQLYQWEAFFDQPMDENDCYVEIHAGAGGTESQDWAAMLLRMYLRWAKQNGFAIQAISETPGEEAGIKSTTIKIIGDHAYGWLQGEQGTHRLVRISPFDANARRHTSFASIGVYPVLDETIKIDLKPDDVRIDTYRARGAGGQHVNTTDSAVRLTHVPSGFVVQCQSERSQHKNRATAWAMLRARLYEAEQRRRNAEKQAQTSNLGDIGWGYQVRSYVLQPYQLVKDVRTGAQSAQPQQVLDGMLEPFLKAALATRSTS